MPTFRSPAAIAFSAARQRRSSAATSAGSITRTSSNSWRGGPRIYLAEGERELVGLDPLKVADQVWDERPHWAVRHCYNLRVPTLSAVRPFDLAELLADRVLDGCAASLLARAEVERELVGDTNLVLVEQPGIVSAIGSFVPKGHLMTEVVGEQDGVHPALRQLVADPQPLALGEQGGDDGLQCGVRLGHLRLPPPSDSPRLSYVEPGSP